MIKTLDNCVTMCYINIMDKDKFVTIRISKEEKDLLRKDAEEEHRNTSNLLVWCWKQWRDKSKRKRND